MMGRIESARSSFFNGKSVRVATNAKASPSAVEPAPQASARSSVFQATPQRCPPEKQPSPQILIVNILPTNDAADQPPASFWKALERMRKTG